MKKLALALGLTLIVVAGCGPSAQPIPPTPTSTSLPTPTPIVVTFDGNECTVSGPTELPTGEHPFLLKDLSGQRRVLYVSHLLDGKTFQDLLDLQSEPGEFFPQPSWVINAGRRPTEWIAEGEHLYTFSLNKEREHAIYLGKDHPLSLWFCAPLKVMEAPFLGCAAPTPAPTPTPELTPTAAPITRVEELVGLWLSFAYLQFKGDGTYRLGTSPDTIEDNPYIEGEFWFEGGQLFIKDSAGIPGWDVCVGLPAGSYEVQGAVKHYFILVAIDDPCETRDSGLTYMPFEWVSP